MQRADAVETEVGRRAAAAFIAGDDPLGHATWAAQRALGRVAEASYIPPWGFGPGDLAGRHIVAHSRGAAMVVLRVCASRVPVRSLVLVEPPLFQCAPASAAVRSARLALERARAHVHPEVAYRTFAHALSEPLTRRLTRPEIECGKRLCEVLPVWSEPAPSLARLREIPTIVVSGDWSTAFEDVARALAEAGGAEHVLLPGRGHNPQHLGRPFNEIVARLWSTCDEIGARR
jgi:pimeloyl-ACP methyl ester carboxylesterase